MKQRLAPRMPLASLKSFDPEEAPDAVPARDDAQADAASGELAVAAAVIDTPVAAGVPDALPGTSSIVEIAVRDIDPSPYQPRIMFSPEAIDALAASIESEGQLVPISVRPAEGGRYQLIAGERRLRAHEILGKETIKAYVVDTRSDFDAAVAALADNEARTDLSDYERGKAFQRLLSMPPAPGEPRLTQVSLAKRIAKSEATISRCMTFFNLPAEAIVLLDKDPALIGGKNAMILVGLTKKGHADIVLRALKRIKEDGVSEQGAINWALAEVTRANRPRIEAYPLSIKGLHVGDIKVDGTKVVITCVNGFTPDELIQRIRGANLDQDTSLTEARATNND